MAKPLTGNWPLEAGFDQHFTKPVDIDVLEAFVNSAA